MIKPSPMKETKIRLTSNFDIPLEQEIEAIWGVYTRVFEQSSSGHKASLVAKIQRIGTIHCMIAYDNDQPIGFKLGYPKSRDEFYSWLGGVSPHYRHLGIATALIKHQHEWARGAGFKTITTETENKFKPMLMLNLKMGFNIQGTYQHTSGSLRIMLIKSLA